MHRLTWMKVISSTSTMVGGELHDAVKDLVELGVISLERQLLGHKVDGHGFIVIL